MCAGSGVLAIAALKMGASEALGTDTDALAVHSAKCNADLNGVAASFRAVQCSASPADPEPVAAAGLTDVERSLDVCVANILQVRLQPKVPFNSWNMHRSSGQCSAHIQVK